MHGIEHCDQKRRTFRHSAPQSLVYQLPDQCFLARRNLSSARDRMLVTAFYSPATIASYEAPVPGSKLPACYFASQLADSAARSAFQLHRRIPVSPGTGRFSASSPLQLPQLA
jgi:hypothetical protein